MIITGGTGANGKILSSTEVQIDNGLQIYLEDLVPLVLVDGIWHNVIFFEMFFHLFQTLGLTDPCPVSALPTQRDDHVTKHSGYSPDKYKPMEEQDVPL